MLGTHRVSVERLDAMAEGISDPATVEELKKANRSRQLVMLRAVLEQSRTLTAPLPPLDEAWSLLSAVERQDEAAVDTVIAHPHTGLWNAKLLRMLDQTEAAAPLWACLGHVHLMAAAAAIRAGHDFRARVPVWRGSVMLPTLGLAVVPSDGEWSVAEVRGTGGEVVVGGVRLPEDWAVDGPGWLALRTIRADGLSLWLDDIDPYREFDGPLPPRRLPDSEVALWTESLRQTWRLLSDHHPKTAAELASGLMMLVPCTAAEQYSASHNDAFGSVVLSRPPDATSFATTLVHEFQHSKFGVLLSLVELLDPKGDNETPRLYAPWRDDPRPATGLLHGVFSFLGVAGFYRDQSIIDSGSAARAAQFEFERHREQVLEAAEALLSEAAVSELGRRFLNKVCDRLRKWGTEPIPDDVREAAQRANAEHRLSWHARHRSD